MNSFDNGFIRPFLSCSMEYLVGTDLQIFRPLLRHSKISFTVANINCIERALTENEKQNKILHNGFYCIDASTTKKIVVNVFYI